MGCMQLFLEGVGDKALVVGLHRDMKHLSIKYISKISINALYSSSLTSVIIMFLLISVSFRKISNYKSFDIIISTLMGFLRKKQNANFIDILLGMTHIQTYSPPFQIPFSKLKTKKLFTAQMMF